MKKITIDTNCIIDLEEERESEKYVRSLIKMHGERKISLRVVSIGASERKIEGSYVANFREFKDKLEKVGLDKVEILRPIGYYGISFWGQGLWANEKMIELEEKIHKILFPGYEFKCKEYFESLDAEYSHDSPLYHKWRNAKCDVLSLWAHIHFHGDVFVTSDKNFHKQSKKSDLINLGAGAILTPEETIFFLNN
ncbi:hypothetical protein ACFL6P_00475 [Candidatus Latescibacterota bacterium]